MQFKYIGFLFVVCITSCATQPPRSTDLDSYLKRFIGQSAATIQSELNLAALGYQTDGPPRLSERSLVYTIVRPLNIPIPSIPSIDHLNHGVIISTGNASQTYDLNFQCRVIFNLTDHIADSVQYQGKAC
ncbi:hypothetical protein [uncultured Acinetobacter sp.]|uniref:hypothetical protein n=1 Tax=uncultured Acinetobacter sp. TaxID=165433 RepID=UPI002586ACFA|nr:hypothetical protein [uncultured Acinetobacter sp.]